MREFVGLPLPYTSPSSSSLKEKFSYTRARLFPRLRLSASIIVLSLCCIIFYLLLSQEGYSSFHNGHRNSASDSLNFYASYNTDSQSLLETIPVFNLRQIENSTSFDIDLHTNLSPALFPAHITTLLKDTKHIDRIQHDLSYIVFYNQAFYSRNTEAGGVSQQEWDSIQYNLFGKESIESLITKSVLHASLLAHGVSNATFTNDDFQELGRSLRSYTLLSTLIDKGRIAEYNIMEKVPVFYKNRGSALLQRLQHNLHNQLFPWYDETIEFSGKGLVFLVGNNQFELAFHAILVCQKLLGTSYPIEVFYGGPSDLDAEKAETLAELDHVTVVDLFQVLPKVHSYGLEGWAMKPFALLASSFEEVIFMDADVLFFQDPAVVFEMQGYKNTGNVFFHDRQMDTGKSKTHEWFEGFMKELSPDANQLQYVKYNTIHEQDSGVVAINKRTSAYYGLLATCIMNLPPFQKTAYANVHGDKETFWISAELIKVPYYFPSGYGGAIGWMNPEKPASSVCGNLYHPDENWKPLWWNGGVKMNKHLHPDLFFNNMTFYATNMDGTQGEWDWETETRPFCYQPIQVNREIGELDEGLKNMGDKMIQTGKLIFEAVKENDMGRLIEISEMAF